MQTTTKQITFAAAAALIAITSAATSTPVFAAHSAKVACYGVNACKGQSDCKSGNHDCKGQNTCKGQGFKDLSKSACVKAGGSLTAPK